MKLLLRMRFVFLLGLALSAFSLAGNAQIQRIVDDPELKGASISVVLSDLITGEILDSYDEDRRLCPASVWKLLTSAAALEILGPDFRFRTELSLRGKVENGVLYGDVVIIGSGDPSLGSRHFGEDLDFVLEQWSSAIRSLGIDSITGDIIGNAAYLQGDGLPRTRVWEDMGNYYGTAVSGLNIADNTYFLAFSTPDEPGEVAEITDLFPEVPGLEIRSEVESSTIQADRAFIFGSPLDETRIVRGTLPAGRDRFVIKGSVPNPPLFAAFHLEKKLSELGIGIGGTARAELLEVLQPSILRKIHSSFSPELKDLVAHTLKESDNLFAEAILIQLGAERGEANLESGIEALHEIFGPVMENQYPFFAYDGSGLSRFNAISANQLMELLKRCRKKDELHSYLLQAMPLAGREGTMKWFGRSTNLESNLRGKSGSMDRVRAYAGYFTSFSGRELGFVILINTYEGSGTVIRKKVEDWLLRSYGQF
jgi:D-alanyl-D-alanine carboxypeptidase/D-alanyl-D-alanine-endopeptidase (penicillin-binding protein 4)